MAQYKQTILVVFKEIEDSLIGVSTTREQAAAQEQQVSVLKAALHLVDLRYKGGLSNYLDVLIAQRNLFDAELSLASPRPKSESSSSLNISCLWLQSLIRVKV
ncbi:MAG: TolC family protein [Nitrospira sp.]|nr:TolC family protein [Nitrospira sp.]